MPIRLEWDMLDSGEADRVDGCDVEIAGSVVIFPELGRSDYGLLIREARCCLGSLPCHPRSAVEIFFTAPTDPRRTEVVLRGRWRRDAGDEWRYALHDASVTDATLDRPRSTRRRTFLASGAALGLAACRAGPFAAYTEPQSGDGTSGPSLMSGHVTIDMHSHAGRVIVSRDPATQAAGAVAFIAARTADAAQPPDIARPRARRRRDRRRDRSVAEQQGVRRHRRDGRRHEADGRCRRGRPCRPGERHARLHRAAGLSELSATAGTNALKAAGFPAGDVHKVLGGNYLRVFMATLG